MAFEKAPSKPHHADPSSGPGNATINESSADLLANANNAQSLGQIIAPNQFFQSYKYQVGLGNNHVLVKALMKQRLWWHHIHRDKNLP